MDGIKGWAAALCVAAIGCALMQMLAPKDGLGKIFKLMLAAFFLCCMAMPLLELGSITSLHVDSLPGDVTNELLQEKVEDPDASIEKDEVMDGICSLLVSNGLWCVCCMMCG